jgi:5-hydroxyisourate hydrolase
MATLTTHVLNIASGIPAAGMDIELRSLADAAAPTLIVAKTNADGRPPAPLLDGSAFRAGRYALTFHVARYFRALDVELANPPFLDEIVITFGIADPRQNYHVPLIVSPWSYATYRGS